MTVSLNFNHCLDKYWFLESGPTYRRLFMARPYLSALVVAYIDRIYTKPGCLCLFELWFVRAVAAVTVNETQKDSSACINVGRRKVRSNIALISVKSLQKSVNLATEIRYRLGMRHILKKFIIHTSSDHFSEGAIDI
ncbi:hypothetical protein TcasGA2_TC006369 [Tribolium castaneum]|uniref:Uncharacterized protein n=1 Tax=Tribolium castaneum TaxID=7070 RepID=D6WWD7_TRICA|nr:hypothetical protein TcasGA2_TC006369 [Tribolium castaneum]